MKKTMMAFLALCCVVAMQAQTSRKTIERFATEAVRQMTLTGRTPTIDILDSLANNAEVSVEMLSRMGEPDDVRQAKACLKLIDCIVDYSQTATGRKYTDVVRGGLKKALDRSYDTDVQLHVMQQLARCAKPADAAHIAMYLEVPELAQAAYSILVGMQGVDDRIAEAASAQPGIKAKVQEILDIHAGKKKASVIVESKPRQSAVPFWPESLDREIDNLGKVAEANNIVINDAPAQALPKLLELARQKNGSEREGIMARFVQVAERADMTPEKKYLVLRDADDVDAGRNIRNKIILLLGNTHTVQALAYLRKYYGKEEYADAMAVATTEIISAHPEANCGNMVNGMLYNAKRSFIRHYDEQNVDSYIDIVLASIDNWHAAGGYNMNHTEDTKMEKRGFWVIHDELQNFDMAFDWCAACVLTLSLRSVPTLVFDRGRGVCIVGEEKWYKTASTSGWSTASISVNTDRISVTVDGERVIDNVKLPGGQAVGCGSVKFLADEYGATVRGYCFRKK